MSDKLDQRFSASNPKNQRENEGSVQVTLPVDELGVLNPNYALSAVQTFNTFNRVANEMFGIEVRWFRAVPQQRSKDVIFKEYTLSCVEDEPLCLKVVVPDGNFPDSKYQYDLMGLEYEVPTEIQIDKAYWESIAGQGTAPQKKDIVYVAIPNKLYQVESSYLKRGFMEQETTWVINLRKYSPESSRKEGEALKETINKYTVSEEEIFGDAQKAERDKLRNDKQMSPFNSTERDEHKKVDEDLKIVVTDTEFYGTIFSQAYYDMNSSNEDTLVEYTNPAGDQINLDRDRALTSWIRPVDKYTEYNVLKIAPYNASYPPANYKIEIKGQRERFKKGDFFTIYRSEAINFYAEVIDDSLSHNGVYHCKIDEDVINHLSTISPNWNNLKNYKLKAKKPICLINGIGKTSDVSFTAHVLANQYIKIKYGSQEYISIMDRKINDNEWYGIVVNIGNTWNQYNVYVWEQHPSDTLNKLRIRYYDTLRITPEIVSLDKYTLERSSSHMTNIRLFMTTIEEEKQPKELLSFFTKDAEQALILDNCDPKFRAPYISRQR